MQAFDRTATTALPCRLQELAFALVRGSLAEAPWQVLQERCEQVAGRKITLQIVGSSHVVQVTGAGLALAEVLVERRHLPPGLEVLAAAGLSSGTTRQAVTVPGITYRAVGRVDSLEPEAMSARLDAFVADRSAVLKHAFPGPAGDAWTAIRYTLEQGGLELETVHTYPEAGAWVETASSWGWQ